MLAREAPAATLWEVRSAVIARQRGGAMGRAPAYRIGFTRFSEPPSPPGDAAPPGIFFGLGFVTGGLFVGQAALWFDRLRYVRR